MNLTLSEQLRYSRHILLKEIGEAGQLKLKTAKVLVVGAGGLGCPVLQYLAAAGVGYLGVMDFDIVSISNLQRQLLFSDGDVGKYKSSCAAAKLRSINPGILVIEINERLTVRNIRNIFDDYDVIVDGTDNFETRYLINDGCILSNKPYVFGSLEKFSGHVAVFNQSLPDGNRSANYRHVFPIPPDQGIVINCAEAGVLGSVAGIIGTFQATETIKLITGTGNSLTGKLLFIDTLQLQFITLEIADNKLSSTVVPQSWEELENFDYQQFCNSSPADFQINHSELELLLASGKPIQVLDVREEWEISGDLDMITTAIPLFELQEKIKLLDRDMPTVVLCESGSRSTLAVKILQNSGFTNAVSLNGGLQKWMSNKST